MRTRNVLVGLKLLVLAGLAAAAPLKFAATAQAGSGTLNLPGPTDYHFSTDTVPQTVTAASTQQENVGSGAVVAHGESWSSAFAYAGPGGLRLYAGSNATVATSGAVMVAQSSGTASGSIDDGFTIWATQCANAVLCGTGAFGTMTFSMLMNGSMGGGGVGSYSLMGQWTADLSLSTGYLPGAPGSTSASWHGDQYLSLSSSAPPFQSGSDGFGRKTFTVSFAFGTPISLHMAGTAMSSSGVSYIAGNAAASFATDLSHTFAWGGISSVTDAAGNPVIFSALSAGSGFDYAHAFASSVPEPAPSALLAAGLLALLPLLRRATRP
jgi:hypothetical protein